MNSIKWKTFIVFIITFIIALTISFLSIFNIVSKDLKNLAINNANSEISFVIKNLDNQLEHMHRTYKSLVFNENIIGELKKSKDEIDYKLILDILENAVYATGYNIYSIYLKDVENNILLSTEEMGLRVDNTVWLENYSKSTSGKGELVHTVDLTSSLNVMLSYIGEIKEDFFGDTIAYLSVNVLRHNIQQNIVKDVIYPNSIQFILDKNNNIMAKSENFDINMLDIFKEEIENNSIIKYNQQEYLYLNGEVSNKFIKYIKLIPTNEIFSSIYRMEKILTFYFLIFSIMILVITYKLLDYITVPIYELSKKIYSYRQNSKEKVDFTTKRKDEFAYLFKSLEYMTNHIDHLIDELYESKLYKKEMQIRLYRESINPHFVHNILDSIIWTLKFKKFEKAEVTLCFFADFFRYSLSLSQDYITIEETKLWLESYCYLASFLKDDRIEVNIEIENDINMLYMPSLLIQPIIENSFKHAFKGNMRGKIYTKIEREKGWLKVRIEDTGKGMSKEELERLILHISEYEISKSTKHFGLASVYQRLILLYGEKAIFNISSEIDKGTIIYFEVEICNKR